MHSNLSFPLLRKLSEVGDPIANRVFKEEIALRMRSKSQNVINFLLEERYLDGFNKEELEVIFEDSLFLNIINDKKLLDYLVFTYLRVGLGNLVIKDLKIIIENYPKNADAWYYLGLTYYQKSRLLSQVITKFKKNKEKHTLPSSHRVDNYIEYLNKALKAYKKTLEINPNMIKAWNTLATIYKLLKDFDNSIHTSKHVLKLKPDDKFAQYNLIHLYLNRREFKNLNLIEVIQQINFDEQCLLFGYKCPQCGKVNTTDFKRIKFCRSCNTKLSKSGKYEKFKLRGLTAAGSWYPKNKKDLKISIEDCFKRGKYSPGEIPIPLDTQRTVIGGIVPNSGYIYSGYASAHTFLNLFKEKIPDTIIILSPDLVGYNKIGIMGGGTWETPLGNITVDSDLSLNIAENCQNIDLDDTSFLDGILKQDHSIEIQLPFIKYCSEDKNIKIVPLLTPHNINYEAFEELSLGISNVIEQSKKDIVSLAIGAISHFSIHHKEDLKKFGRLDKNFINSFTDFSPKITYSNLLKIPGNGLGTITLLMLLCKKLGASKCKPLKYYTSYDMIGSGNYSAAYFSGVIIKKKK